MADKADIANDEIEKSVSIALQNIRRRKEHSLIPDGCCHYCANEIEEHKLFCGPECAIAYERRKA